MEAMKLPVSPTVGQIYSHDLRTWIWNGFAWVANISGGNGATGTGTIGSTGPTGTGTIGSTGATGLTGTIGSTGATGGGAVGLVNYIFFS